MDGAWGGTWATPVTSPCKSPQRQLSHVEWADEREPRRTGSSADAEETETEDGVSFLAYHSLYSSTLLFLIVAATAAVATNRVSEVRLRAGSHQRPRP